MLIRLRLAKTHTNEANSAVLSGRLRVITGRLGAGAGAGAGAAASARAAAAAVRCRLTYQQGGVLRLPARQHRPDMVSEAGWGGNTELWGGCREGSLMGPTWWGKQLHHDVWLQSRGWGDFGRRCTAYNRNCVFHARAHALI